MNTVRIMMMAMITLCFVVSAAAQDNPNPLPEPESEMEEMAWFIGEWDVVSRFLNEEEWVEERLTTVHTYELNGHIILENFGGPIFGESFQAWSLRTYNTNTGLWEQRWTDTSPGAFADWTGYYDAEKNEFHGFSNRGLAEPNQFEEFNERAARETFFDITEDGFSWKYETTADGGETWTTTWTLDYTRQSS